MQQQQQQNLGLKEYSPYINTVFINNNYLKLNPIYDANNKKIYLSNEYSDTLTILVPQKYKAFDNDIRVTYDEWYTWKKFVDEDAYNKAIGNPAVQHKNLTVNIIYVPNNQKYFTFNPNYAVNKGNQIIDPIAIIVNNVNLGTDNYLCFLSNQNYFGKITNYDNPYKSLSTYIKDSGLSVEISTTPSLYSVIDTEMYKVKQRLTLDILAFCLTIIILLIIIIFTVLNYLERNKVILAIKKIHGYSFLKRHQFFYLLSIVFWISMLIILNIRNTINFMSILIIIGVLIFVELLIVTLIINFVEIRKQKFALKGE